MYTQESRAFDINHLMVNVSVFDQRVEFLQYNDYPGASLVTQDPPNARTLQVGNFPDAASM